MQSLSSTKIFAIANFLHNPLKKKILGGKLFQAFNLNPLLKLLSYLMVTTCNNLPHKICCEYCKNVVKENSYTTLSLFLSSLFFPPLYFLPFLIYLNSFSFSIRNLYRFFFFFFWETNLSKFWFVNYGVNICICSNVSKTNIFGQMNKNK